MGYKEDKKIDKHHLDDEWETQDIKCREYGKLWADAEEDCDRLKDDLDRIKAKINNEIILANNNKKPSDVQIDREIVLDKRYQEANDKYIEAKALARNLKVVYSSIADQRKKGLDRLTDLYLQGYWADYKVCETREKVRERYQEKEIEVLEESMSKRELD